MAYEYRSRDGVVVLAVSEGWHKICSCCGRLLPVSAFGFREMPPPGPPGARVVLRDQPQCIQCRGLTPEQRHGLQVLLGA